MSQPSDHDAEVLYPAWMEETYPVPPDEPETSRTLEVSVAELEGQLHVAVIHEQGEDHILIDKDHRLDLVNKLLAVA